MKKVDKYDYEKKVTSINTPDTITKQERYHEKKETNKQANRKLYRKG